MPNWNSAQSYQETRKKIKSNAHTLPGPPTSHLSQDTYIAVGRTQGSLACSLSYKPREVLSLLSHGKKKVIILYHQLPRKCMLMITKDERHVKVKKQRRNVSKILSLEHQALFLISLHFHILLFLKPLSWLQKTFCFTPVLTKNRVGNTTIPFQPPNSPVCSLLQDHDFSLPATKFVHLIKKDIPSSFSLLVRNTCSKVHF